MKRSVKIFFGISLAASLSALAASAQTAMNLGNLPLWFEASHTDGSTDFIAHGNGAEFSISPAGAEFSLHKKDGQTATVQLRFVGGNTETQISGETLPGKVNYFLGNNPAQWQSGLPTYGKVRCDNIYPGVNVVYYGNQRQLEYDFDLAAGVNPSTIAMRFDGAKKISINSQGELVVAINGGEVIQHTPEIYQNVGGLRHEISGGYKILDAHTVTFSVGQCDRSLPLVIDPLLSYSTYFGGTLGDSPWAIAVDGSKNVYIAGWTYSSLRYTNGPGFATAGAFQTNYQHGSFIGDGFVAKFDSQGNNLWVTYLGGNGDNAVTSLALDSSDNVYLTGWTDATNFPTANSLSGAVPGIPNSTNIAGVYDKNLKTIPSDAFVTELDHSGSNLIYSLYLGGSAQDVGYGITVDPTGNAYVVGTTYSSNFPVTFDAKFSKLQCTNSIYYNANAFVAKIAAGGTNLNYSTYLGGTNNDFGTAIAYANGNVFVAGYTTSTNFFTANVVTNEIASYYLVTNTVHNVRVATTNYSYFNSTLLNGSTNKLNLEYDGFVTAFQPQPTNTSSLKLLYSTYLGGTNDDFAYGIAADANTNAYVVGSTISYNFPVITNGLIYITNTSAYVTNEVAFSTNITSFVQTNGLDFFATNGFLTQIKWNNTNNTASIGYSMMFGGRGVDVARGVALAPDGNVFVTGYASSTNFPVTPGNLFGSLRATNSGKSDAFVMAFSNNAPVLLYSTYLGGKSDDFAYGVAVDADDSAYVVGQTLSTNFPTFDAQQTFRNGTNDTFIAKILFPVPAISLEANLSGTNMIISWPPIGNQVTTNQMGLQSITNLLSINWMSITNLPVLTNGAYTYKFRNTNSMEFFRLHKF